MSVTKPLRSGRRQQGLTLVELVISIVILSIAMVAVLNSFSFSIARSADPLWRNKSLKLAQLYLDEILAKNYDDATPVGGLPVVSSPGCAGLGPESAETRATYNDVDDYDGLSDNPPQSLLGNLDSSYAAYTVTVAVECDGDRVGASGGVADNHAKKITVTVIPPGENGLTFAAYKGNF